MGSLFKNSLIGGGMNKRKFMVQRLYCNVYTRPQAHAFRRLVSEIKPSLVAGGCSTRHVNTGRGFCYLTL